MYRARLWHLVGSEATVMVAQPVACVVLTALLAVPVARAWLPGPQRLSDLRARRLCLRLHEGQRRHAARARAVLLLDRRDRSVLPYERYVTAETVLSMAQTIGNLGTQFRTHRTGQDRGQRSAPRAGGSGSALL